MAGGLTAYAALPHRVQEMIRMYVAEVQRARPGLLQGLYIYGSIALGDFSPRRSDIDFVAVTDERLGAADVAVLQRIHRNIEKSYRKPVFNGIYVTWNDLGKLPDETAPFPYYFQGMMHGAGYFEMNLVTWHELKNGGICIIGPGVSELSFAVDWERLLANMHINLNTYWHKWIERASRRFSLLSVLLAVRRNEIEWGVLGISRLFYTFRENGITSKSGAGEYAIGIVPERWHRIIRESIGVRRGLPSLYRSPLRRKRDALGYMRYMLEMCRKLEGGG